MTVNTNYSSMASTLATLRQQQALQTETPAEKTPTVQVQTEQHILPTENPVENTWSRVNVKPSIFKRIVAEQKANNFFETSSFPKTVERTKLVVDYLLRFPKEEFCDKILVGLEKPVELHSHVIFKEVPPVSSVATGGIANVKTAFAAASLQPTGGIASLQVYSVTSSVLSWSSKRMSQLLNWRNTESQAQSSKVRTFVTIAKKAVTEVALPFITVSSIVESVATKLLSLGARVIKRDATHLNAVRKSAIFTIFWSATTLYHNVKEKVLEVDEKVAREAVIKKYIKV